MSFLFQSENLLKLITEHLPDMLWIKDLEGKYIYVNDTVFVNAEMIKQGLALIETIPPNIKYANFSN